MKNGDVELILKKHQNQLQVDGSRITFVGSVNYADVANDVVQLYKDSLKQKTIISNQYTEDLSDKPVCYKMWNHILKFVYDNNREPKVLILHYAAFDDYVKERLFVDEPGRNRFAMCKVITSVDVDFIEVY